MNTRKKRKLCVLGGAGAKESMRSPVWKAAAPCEFNLNQEAAVHQGGKIARKCATLLCLNLPTLCRPLVSVAPAAGRGGRSPLSLPVDDFFFSLLPAVLTNQRSSDCTQSLPPRSRKQTASESRVALLRGFLLSAVTQVHGT